MKPETKMAKVIEMARALGPKRGGRPKKNDAKNRTEWVQLRVSKKEKDILSLACSILRMSYTTLLLDYGLENAKALLKAEGVQLHEESIDKEGC